MSKQPIHQPFDVVIVGGGLIGCMLARTLAQYRLHIALVEKAVEVGFGTSKANSGIIHGGHHSAPTSLKGKLEWAGNQRWEPLCNDLGVGFKRVGELTVAFDPEEIPELQRLLRYAEAKRIPGLTLWSGEQVRQAEPALSEAITAAVYTPTTAVINPYEACFGLAESAIHNGVTLLTNCEVQRLVPNQSGWTIYTSNGTLPARFVLNAAGLYADEIAELAGVRTFTIQPRKGEEYLLDKRLKGIVKHVIFPCPTPVSKGILLTPTFDGTIMVGPTAEASSDKADCTTTMAGSAIVFAAAQRLAPGLSERDCIAEFAGVRATVAGDDFIIGPTAKRGFLNVAGIQSPGLTAAPAIAELVVELLRDEGLALIPNPAFVPTLPKPIRFATLPTAEQIALAAHDVRYGRIVCRCESVTEGEVCDAIRRGARTLDGIKFRTRTGMGRCQGGFCTARSVEILARELAIPVAAVTKRGGNSWLLRERSEQTTIDLDHADTAVEEVTYD